MDVDSSQQGLAAAIQLPGERAVAVDYPSGPGIWLCDHVHRVKAYAILSGAGLETNALPKEIRARLIRPAALEAFNSKSEKQSWKICTYRAGKTEVNAEADARRYQDLIDALREMTNLFHRQKQAGSMPLLHIGDLPEARRIGFAHGEVGPEARYPCHQRPEIFLCDPDPSLKFGSLQVELPDLPPEAEGKFIIVLFDRPVKERQDFIRENNQDALVPTKRAIKNLRKKTKGKSIRFGYSPFPAIVA